MNSIDKELLTIPIYLNQKVVFDMLASIYDGFAEVKTIQSSNVKNREDNIEGELGQGNFFAFLNIGFKGNLKKENSAETKINEEKTHTPVSLFQMLKLCLEENSLIKDIESNEVMEGDFVEIQGVLKQNPLISALENFQKLFALINSIEDNSKKNNTKNKAQDNKKIEAAIKSIIEELQSGNKVDIICKTDTEQELVIPTDISYFLNENRNEVTDGKYKILGKVSKICYDDSESINLLRNTAFSLFKLDKLNFIVDQFNDETLKDFLNDIKVVNEINAPTMMIIPIAIYL